LYRDHFPLSLVYSVYAPPDFQMPQDGAPVASPGAINLSFQEKLGTRNLGVICVI